MDEFNNKAIIPDLVLVKMVGHGTSTRFWKDVWVGDMALKDGVPHLYLLE